jgi:hypothetical protein
MNPALPPPRTITFLMGSFMWRTCSSGERGVEGPCRAKDTTQEWYEIFAQPISSYGCGR